jgi:SAM-dependent methyltransferase
MVQADEFTVDGWRDADTYGINLSTWWDIPERGDRFPLLVAEFHGAFVPQIAQHAILRYTDPGDVVLDPFVGSGTTLQVATHYRRSSVGIDINPQNIETIETALRRQKVPDTWKALVGDTLDPSVQHHATQAITELGHDHAGLALVHPPYLDIIRFTNLDGDLSGAESMLDFQASMLSLFCWLKEVVRPGGTVALVIGDLYTDSQLVPLGFETITTATIAGLTLKGICVKNIAGNEVGKGKAANLWKARAWKGRFYTFEHEYIAFLEVPKK